MRIRTILRASIEVVIPFVNILLALVFLLFTSTSANALTAEVPHTASWESSDQQTYQVFKESQDLGASNREEQRLGHDDPDVLPADYSFIAPTAGSLFPQGIAQCGFTSAGNRTGNAIRAPPFQA